MQFLTNIDLAKNELQNAVLQNLASAPSTPKAGQIYYSSADSKFYGWNGSAWVDLSLVLSNKAIVDATTASFTTALKTKLDGIATGATKVEISATNGNIKINGTEITVYTNPGITGSNVTSALGYTPVKDGGNTPELRAGTEATRPAATGSGMVYFSIDTKKIWKDTTTGTWTQMGGQDSVAWTAITGKPTTFTPPVATTTALGGIKVGANLTVTADGTLNANDNPASFIRKQERFTVSAGQTVFNLTKGTYKPNTGAVTWFLNGDKQDDMALTETSSTRVTLPTGLPEGSAILFEYYEVINWHPFPGHASEHLTGGADPIPKATTTSDGLMAKEDKVSLNSKETPSGAQAKADNALASAKSYTDTKVADLVSSAPGTLDTLKELAEALGNDPNFATTITNQLALRTKKYVASIGNGTATTFTVTHNLNTQDVTVTIREMASPYNVVFADLQVTNVNAITVLFGSAPTANQYRVTVTG
ncbi:hypothetical protein [Lysinibacillus xylanilyticus]|uniref:hypothetical protein n=1 Tax=Lysinibacillus xylanilyticus TaxID=582475 RepID=UPI00381660C8